MAPRKLDDAVAFCHKIDLVLFLCQYFKQCKERMHNYLQLAVLCKYIKNLTGLWELL